MFLNDSCWTYSFSIIFCYFSRCRFPKRPILLCLYIIPQKIKTFHWFVLMKVPAPTKCVSVKDIVWSFFFAAAASRTFIVFLMFLNLSCWTYCFSIGFSSSVEVPFSKTSIFVVLFNSLIKQIKVCWFFFFVEVAGFENMRVFVSFIGSFRVGAKTPSSLHHFLYKLLLRALPMTSASLGHVSVVSHWVQKQITLFIHFFIESFFGTFPSPVKEIKQNLTPNESKKERQKERNKERKKERKKEERQEGRTKKKKKIKKERENERNKERNK